MPCTELPPDQQRAVDGAIVEGTLLEAIRLYRSATQASLAEANGYVHARASLLVLPVRSAPPPSAPSDVWEAPSAFTIAQPVARRSNVGWLIAGLSLAVVGIVAAFVVLIVSTRFFGIFSIVRESYYRSVVERVTSDEAFRAELGRPISIDDGGVWCSTIEDSSTIHRATCEMPASGPKGDGSIHVQLVDLPDSGLDLTAWLHVGDRTIPMHS